MKIDFEAKWDQESGYNTAGWAGVHKSCFKLNGQLIGRIDLKGCWHLICFDWPMV